MDNWKISLDRYLTSEPQDDFSPWVELVINNFSDEFYKEAYEDRTDWEDSELENKWLNKLYNLQVFVDVDDKGRLYETGRHTPESTAKLIERAFRIYKI